ncbi:ice-binding family protein [Cryobacterium sp. PH31-L1]|uniref:ice-binding family protein n=1 Tax=Cryobacterium sp. PH31-L1 TaxID=3046199 RepID=UPI0024B961CF|nr:ice-binding family protein [Cryobacterium sp. PH31-L1]MDJ0378838.1 ice-binding family protein [Cryobacterium sp. PH31-L1]
MTHPHTPRRRPARFGGRRTHLIALPALTILVLLGGLLVPQSRAEAATSTVDLKTAGSYSVLARNAIANTGTSALSGNAGTSPGTAITGFLPGILTGSIHAGDSHATAAQADLVAAYTDAAGRVPTTSLAGDLAGRTLTAGVYKSTAALAVSTTLTLDAQNDPTAVFIFQIDAAFNTAAASSIVLANGAQASNVFWQVVGAVSLGAASSFTGNILGLAAISIGAGTTLIGRALTSDGAISMASNIFMTEPPLNLRTAGSYSVLAGASVVNSGGTTLSGFLGVSPATSVSGFPPGLVTGSTHLGTAESAQAQIDLQLAINDAAARTPTATLSGNLGGQTYNAGVYAAPGSLTVGSSVTFDGQGNPNAVFIFQLDGDLTTSAGTTVRLINGAQASRVFWQVDGVVQLGAASAFSGIIVGQGAITVGTHTSFTGRALTRSGTVALGSNAFTTEPVVNLGSASTYAILATTSVANTGNSSLDGDIGVSPGTAVTGFPPGVLTGTIHGGDTAAAAAQIDLAAAYKDAAARPATAAISGDLAGRTLTSGVYKSTAALAISTTLTLDGQGNPNAIFIIQVDAAFNTAAGSIVVLTNGAQASRVYWQIAGAVSLGAASAFSGTIVGMAAISIGAGVGFVGRALTANGAVSMSTASSTSPAPAAGDLTATTAGATLSAVTLLGTDSQFATGLSSQWSIVDARGTGAAWTLSVSATAPTSAVGTVETVERVLPVENLSITPGAITTGPNTDAATGITAPTLALSASPQTLIATSGPNRGTYLLTPAYSLMIPANAYRSNYSGAIDASTMNPYVTVITFTIS